MRPGSRAWPATIRSIICRIERASPASRRVSPAANQLKQHLGLLARRCSGSSRAKPKRAARSDQPQARSKAAALWVQPCRTTTSGTPVGRPFGRRASIRSAPGLAPKSAISARPARAASPSFVSASAARRWKGAHHRPCSRAHRCCRRRRSAMVGRGPGTAAFLSLWPAATGGHGAAKDQSHAFADRGAIRDHAAMPSVRPERCRRTGHQGVVPAAESLTLTPERVDLVGRR